MRTEQAKKTPNPETHDRKLRMRQEEVTKLCSYASSNHDYKDFLSGLDGDISAMSITTEGNEGWAPAFDSGNG
jgi:hypothetical protein